MPSEGDSETGARSCAEEDEAQGATDHPESQPPVIAEAEPELQG